MTHEACFHTPSRHEVCTLASLLVYRSLCVVIGSRSAVGVHFRALGKRFC